MPSSKSSSKAPSSSPANNIYINNNIVEQPKMVVNQPPTAPAEDVKPDEPQASSQEENSLEPQASSQQENPLDMMIRGQCPACKKNFKSPVGHINRSDCKNQVSHEVILEFQAIQKKKRKDESEGNKRKADPIGFNEDLRNRVAESRDKMRKADPSGVKETQRKL